VKIRTLDDGTLALDERLTWLRWATAIGAMALVAVFVFSAEVRGSLTLREYAGGAAGFLALLGLSSAVADRSFRFERASGTVRWRVQRLFSTRTGEAPFADVERVLLRTSTDGDDRHHVVRYQPILVTRAGQLPLSSFHGSNAADCEVVARAVSEALGRNYEAPREATIEELVAAGHILEAVRRVRHTSAVKGGVPMGLAEAKAIVDGYRRDAAKRAVPAGGDEGASELRRAA